MLRELPFGENILEVFRALYGSQALPLQRCIKMIQRSLLLSLVLGGGGSQGDSPEFRLCYVKPALISFILNSQPIRLEVFWKVRTRTDIIMI